jgi:hypothetical protein
VNWNPGTLNTGLTVADIGIDRNPVKRHWQSLRLQSNAKGLPLGYWRDMYFS